jgi:hypothetical protein
MPTIDELRTMTFEQRLRIALDADGVWVIYHGRTQDEWDCQGDIEELLEECEWLRAALAKAKGE